MKTTFLDPRKAPIAVKEKMDEIYAILKKKFPKDRFDSLVLVVYSDPRNPDDNYYMNMAASTKDHDTLIDYLRAIVASFDEKAEPTNEKPTAIH